MSRVWTGAIVLSALPAGTAEPACVTLDQVVAGTGLPRERVTRLVSSMNKRGLVTMVSLACYRRTPLGDAALESGGIKSGPRGPRAADAPAKKCAGITNGVWRMLRRMRKATVPELLELLDTTGLVQAERMAQRYLKRLREAGVTTLARRNVPGTAETSPGFLQHVLVVDLGPQAPVWQARHRRLFDRNRNRDAAEIVRELLRGGKAAANV